MDWKRGDEIVIAPTSFEPYHTEILKIGKVEKCFVVVVFFRFTVMISILGNLSSSILSDGRQPEVDLLHHWGVVCMVETLG